MPYEKRDNSGLIADNERKEKDTHPDMTGSVTVKGVDMWVSGWWKDGRKGRFLSLAFRDKDVQTQGRASAVSHRTGEGYKPVNEGHRPSEPRKSWAEEIDDDLPF